MNRRIRITPVALAMLAAALAWMGARAAAQPGEKEKAVPEKVQKAERQLKDELTRRNARQANIIWTDAAAVAETFPKDTFFAVRFRQFPVAFAPPEGLQSSNVFVVPQEGKLEHLADQNALFKYFRTHVGEVKTEKAARAVTQAWLTVVPEFTQDGFFKFEVLTKELEVAKAEGGGLKVTGRTMVVQGGNGDLSVTLTFDDAGNLTGMKTGGEVRPGPRPICQATKLLDADPIVRRMAEQDLLIMGVAARDYLEEQRARATPELREAIDNLWRRMVARGW